MPRFFRDLFIAPSPAELRQRQLDDADRQLAEFEINLEYTRAMRDMFIERIQRLKNEI